jgi:hypothetical protein
MSENGGQMTEVRGWKKKSASEAETTPKNFGADPPSNDYGATGTLIA